MEFMEYYGPYEHYIGWGFWLVFALAMRRFIKDEIIEKNG